jgi:ubiquinone/menaquinone biosynthesis C-methylase UbiE
LSREHFAEIAEDWDRLRESYFSDSVRDKAISISGAKGGETAADIGAGTGFMSRGLVSKGIRVIAVDESPEMLEVARKKLGSRGVDFRLGSAEKLPVGDGEVDLVFANMMLHHVEDPRKVIGEMSRILKDGGRVVLTDLEEHQALFLKTEHQDRWMGFSREVVKGWLEGAGFEEVGVTHLGESCCATSNSGEVVAVGIFAAVATKPIHKIIK